MQQIGYAPVSPPGGRHGQGSWVIRDKTTGEPKMEVWNGGLVDKLNTAKYEMVPTMQHLAEINNPNSLAGEWARR